MKDKIFWDKVAGVYDIFVNLINRKVHKKLKDLISKTVTTDDEVLECACGTGLLTKVIIDKCKKITATDISTNMLKVMRRKFKKNINIQIEEGDVMKIEYADNSFDKVFAANVIHLLDEPKKALQELMRVCRPEGQLIIPTYINKTKDKEKLFIKTVGKSGADFKQVFSFQSYVDFFKEAGYEDVECILIKGKISCAVAIIKKQT